MVYPYDADGLHGTSHHESSGNFQSHVGRNCLHVRVPAIFRGYAAKGLYNVLGCAVFAVLYVLLPQSLHPYLGILGGIGVGYSAGYAWQTVFNTFGALYIASGAFGLVGAIVLRIGTNVGAAVYTMLLDQILNRLFGREMKRRESYV